MYDILCTYPLSSDLFSQAIHPKEPVIALGQALGHVQVQRLPTPSADNPGVPNRFGTVGTIDTAWRTRRHKGSCRALAFSHDGNKLFSAGTDGIVKIAHTNNGKVSSKIAIPLCKQEVDFPTLLHQLNPTTLLLATDSALLYVYDLRNPAPHAIKYAQPPLRPAQTFQDLHADYVTSLSPLPSASAPGEDTKQFLTTGGTTITITDLRKGVLKQSENLEEELFSSTICAGKAIVGSEKGRLRVWNVGQWDDSEQTLRVDKMYDAGADVLATMPGQESGGGGRVAVGGGDGSVRFVNVSGGKKQGRVKLEEEVISHDEMDGVIGLGWVRDGRLVSGGGQSMKIWEERRDEDREEAQQNGIDGESLDDERDDSDDGASGSEEDAPRKRRKKSKKGKGKKGRGTESNVLKFKGLD